MGEFSSKHDLIWAGNIDKGIRVYSATDYNNGFMAMLLFAMIAVIGAFRVRETNCRNNYI
jgi:hypothetical protein